ncbi:MAG: amino acid decarboxylase, partial [Ignavibacteria bacterium]|nr:amino acid decarboxylase [Ignavibacteria bacterium]
FSVSAEYLKSAGDEVINYMDYGIQLGRRFRSLKPWFIIRYFGAEGLRSRIREHIRLAKMFVQLMEKSNDFELIAPAHLGVVCFRAIPSNIKSEDELNNFNENLLRKINKSGKLFLSHTKLNGIYILRISISGLRTQEEHVKKAWELIINTLKEIK